jgi:Domain of unknown function (DUF4845)
MGPDRRSHRMKMESRQRQRGITAIGLLIMVCVFGVIGIAVMRITPLYLQHMRLQTIMDDVHDELGGTGTTPAGIRAALSRHFTVESLNIPSEEIKITQSRNGYQLRIAHESRAPFVADIWFLLVFDKQVEIQR